MEGRCLVLGWSLKFQIKFYDKLPLYPETQCFRCCSTNNLDIGGRHIPKKPNRQQVSLSAGAGAGDCNWNLALSLPCKAAARLSSATENHATYASPRIDKSGRFCSPRAARELALLILYASCLEGTDPVRMLEKRLIAPKELYYEFDKSSLILYDHMSFGGPPITTTTMEEADQLLCQLETESATEAEVLSAPPKLVYGKLLLRFTKKLLSIVVDRWDSHVLIIDQVTPPDWKIDPAGRILEFSILHLAMSEISGVGTRHQIVINEAVDLAKRFCDGAAPRIINGCLRTYVQDLS